MKTVIIIPARFGSSRYEGKPLIKINKIPLIIRVVKKCVQAIGSDNVYVATDDKRISKVVNDYGYKFVMTSKKNLTGTDRVAEASLKIKGDIFINVQGDEPLIKPNDIIKVINFKKKRKKGQRNKEHNPSGTNAQCISQSQQGATSKLPAQRVHARNKATT